MKKYMLAIGAFCALIFAGCSAGVKMTSSWSDNKEVKNTAGGQKILVVGLFGEKSRDLRQHIEEEMAADLGKLGYTAVTSFSEFGPKQFVNITEDKALHLVDSTSPGVYSRVIIVSIADKNSKQSYVSGYYSPYPYYGFYRPYYSPFYPSYYEPGYYKTDMQFSFEVNYYDVTDKKVLYSGQSKVVDPGKPSTFAATYSKVIIKDMQKKNVLG